MTCLEWALQLVKYKIKRWCAPMCKRERVLMYILRYSVDAKPNIMRAPCLGRTVGAALFVFESLGGPANFLDATRDFEHIDG